MAGFEVSVATSSKQLLSNVSRGPLSKVLTSVSSWLAINKATLTTSYD